LSHELYSGLHGHKVSGLFTEHNVRDCEGYCSVSQLLKEKMDVQLLTQGGRVVCIEVPSLSIHFINSLIFLLWN